MADTINCRQCSTPVRRQTIGNITGEEGILRVTVGDFPALVCERGHRRFITRDFPVQLLGHVSGIKTGLPVAKKQGLLFKKLHCSQCDVLLGADSATRTFTSGTTIGDAAMQIELALQVQVCPACKCEQLRDGDAVAGLASTALAHAFQGAEIRPPG